MLSYKEFISLIIEAHIYTHNMTKYSGNLLRELDFIGVSVNLIDVKKMSYKIKLLKPVQLSNQDLYDLFFDITQNQFGYYPSYYEVIFDNITKIFYFKDKHKKKEKKGEKFVDKEAKFKSYLTNTNVEEIIITFEANYEEGLYKNTLPIPKFLYHTGPSIFEKDIKNVGLLPKSKQRSSYFPARIHFLYALNDYENLIKKFKLNDIRKGKPELKYSVYEINTEGLDIILHTDPNSNGCFTYDIIPHKNIHVLYSNL